MAHAVTTGDFSRMTLPTVKALRHHHDVGPFPTAADGPLVERYLPLRPVATPPGDLLQHTTEICWPVTG